MITIKITIISIIAIAIIMTTKIMITIFVNKGQNY